jgi:hypothetical protein
MPKAPSRIDRATIAFIVSTSAGVNAPCSVPFA